MTLAWLLTDCFLLAVLVGASALSLARFASPDRD
jgi:hypothetical protein